MRVLVYSSRKPLTTITSHNNGVVLSREDKEKIKKVLELIFWDVKEKNKRKKD